jgi:phosphoheptose isomerase
MNEIDKVQSEGMTLVQVAMWDDETKRGMTRLLSACLPQGQKVFCVGNGGRTIAVIEK